MENTAQHNCRDTTCIEQWCNPSFEAKVPEAKLQRRSNKTYFEAKVKKSKDKYRKE